MNMIPMSLHRSAARGADRQRHDRSPTFSVIVPLFNKQATVRRTLASIVAQDWTDFEVIVVDDGSTDRSAAEAAAIADPRIRRLRQDNAGPAAARNRAAAAAAGDWLAFIDADDLWMPDHLSTLAGLIRAMPWTDVACTTSRQRREAEIPGIRRSAAGQAIAEIDYLAAAHRLAIQTSCVAVRRSAFDALGGFGPFCPGEDTELWARLALAGPFAVSSAETSIYVRGTWGIMERLERTRTAPALPGGSPVQATLVRSLRDPACRARHGRIRACLDRLHLRDARIALVRGYPDVARAHLTAVSAATPRGVAYGLLVLLPPAMLASGLRFHARVKRRMTTAPDALSHLSGATLLRSLMRSRGVTRRAATPASPLGLGVH